MNVVENIIHHVREPILLIDQRFRILFFNEATARYRHLARCPVERGAKFTSVVSSEREELVKTLIEQAQCHQITETVEAEYSDLEGRSYFFEVTYSPFPIDDVINTCVEIRDITPQKTFERKSLRLLREFQSVLDNANALIFSVDSREYVTDWNNECIRVTGYQKNDILAQRIFKLGDEEHRGQIEAMMTRVLSGSPVYNFELNVRDKHQASLTLLVNVTPRVNEKGDVVGALFVGQDITELSGYRYSLEQQVRDRTEKLKRAVEKERELINIKNRFVSMASHEFRTPLSSIEYAVGAVRSGATLRANEITALDSINRQVDLMKSMLEDILVLEKGENQKIKASYQSFDLISFLNDLSEEVLISRQRSHHVEKSMSHRRINVVCDNKLLRNIFINLLTNAMKFSPGSDRIQLQVNLIDNVWVEVVVKDFGIGIPREELDRIFDPFVRGSNTGVINGTGLGLSIVKRSVDTLRGKLRIESVVGSGTHATVMLPCSPDFVSA